MDFEATPQRWHLAGIRHEPGLSRVFGQCLILRMLFRDHRGRELVVFQRVSAEAGQARAFGYLRPRLEDEDFGPPPASSILGTPGA